MTRYFNEDNDYLMHHGVKGQHWGVRRYQNTDGTLTALEKKRSPRTENRIRQRQLNSRYRYDKAVRRTLERNAEFSGKQAQSHENASMRSIRRFEKANNKAVKAKEKALRTGDFRKYNKQMQKNEKPLKRAMDAIDRSAHANDVSDRDTKLLEDHVAMMKRTYPNKKISDISYNTLKSGKDSIGKYAKRSASTARRDAVTKLMLHALTYNGAIKRDLDEYREYNSRSKGFKNGLQEAAYKQAIMDNYKRGIRENSPKPYAN